MTANIAFKKLAPLCSRNPDREVLQYVIFTGTHAFGCDGVILGMLPCDAEPHARYARRTRTTTQRFGDIHPFNPNTRELDNLKGKLLSYPNLDHLFLNPMDMTPLTLTDEKYTAKHWREDYRCRVLRDREGLPTYIHISRLEKALRLVGDAMLYLHEPGDHLSAIRIYGYHGEHVIVMPIRPTD